MNASVPDLERDFQDTALGFLEDLKELVLRTPTRRFYSDGYSNSFSGCLLFLERITRLRRSNAVTDRINEMLVHLERKLIDVSGVTYSLFTGTTGDLWLLDKFSLGRGDAIAAIYRKHDAGLLRAAGEFRQLYGYDLVSGLVGAGAEQLQRRAFPRGQQVLRAILESLFAAAEPTRDGFRWKTQPCHMNIPAEEARLSPEGVYDLGMAHGICGLIAFLCDVAGRGQANSKDLGMLQGAVTNLASHIPSDPEEQIPYVEGSRPVSRLAWCYGDLAAAFALLKAAVALHEPKLSARALELAVRSSRRDWQSSLATDHGLCHGTIGISYMFLKIHQLTEEPEFRASSFKWLLYFIGWLKSEGKRQHLTDLSLLTGVFGQALVLSALFLDDRAEWDSPLLLDCAAT